MKGIATDTRCPLNGLLFFFVALLGELADRITAKPTSRLVIASAFSGCSSGSFCLSRFGSVKCALCLVVRQTLPEILDGTGEC